jgi:antitoxin PrlF
MTSIVGERGQVTIPKHLRDRLGIQPGELVEFSQENDRLVLRKADQMDRIMSVYGTLKLPRSVDELIEEMRGPADLPPEP